MTPFSPVLLEPRIVPAVWGGTRLATELGIAAPGGEAIGESWLLYDRGNGSNAIAGGGTLREMMQRDTAALLGAGVRPGYGGTFPLLLKFIDARTRLSVQVHPDDVVAAQEGDSGKNEACVVLQAGPDARIVRGLRPGVTRAQFEAVASTAAVEKLLHEFTPVVGDCIDVPTGTVHAFGPDVMLFEVQQNSDITYRLYDWGRPREVHVEKALAVMRYDGVEPAVTAPRTLADGGVVLVENRWFRLRRYAIEGRQAFATEGRFLTVTVVRGSGSLHWRTAAGEATLSLQTASTVLVPACVDAVSLSPQGAFEVFLCDPGVR